MLNLGDFQLTDTIYVPLTTYNSSGASVTITGLAVTDVEIYKDGSVTQRSSDAGIALLDTDGIDFDATTGLHGFSIDLSDDTDAGFYANGSQYWIVLNSITVDGQTVVVGYCFTIGKLNRANVVQINGSVSAAVLLALSANAMASGTVDNTAFTATALKLQADDITDAAPNHWQGRLMFITSGTLAGQFSYIKGYALVGGRGEFDLSGFSSAPPDNTTFIIV